MELYNIHTHKISDNLSRLTEICILNTYPRTFYERKNESPDIWYSCGIHPWYIDDIKSDMDLLSEIAEDDKVVAIGEAGLDKLKGPDMDLQIEVFKMQIELAIAKNIPLIIHCVKAWDELIALHKEYKTDIPWIIHGYKGGAEQTKQLNKIGFKFSIGEKFNPEGLKEIPTGSLFCETDDSDIPLDSVYAAVSETLEIERCHFDNSIKENIMKNFKLLTK